MGKAIRDCLETETPRITFSNVHDKAGHYNQGMTTISIAEIERNFASYLGRVKAGESLVITDHDQPIAELTPITGAEKDLERRAAREFLVARISSAAVPSRWREEGVVEPSDDCRRLSLVLAERLLHEHALIPTKVVASRQEGIYLEYQSPRTGRTLGVEIDNDLDAVAVISDATEVLASAPFENEELERLVRIFVGELAAALGDPGTPAAG